MEWVETTGKTIEEAKEAALDELGVDEQDAEFEVLEEPKVGLFGRLRSEGRIRARVRPTTPRAKEDRRDRRRRTKSSGAGDGAAPTTTDDRPAVDPSPVDRPPRTGRSRSAPKVGATTSAAASGNTLSADAAPALSDTPTGRPRTNPSRRSGARGGTRPAASVPAGPGTAPAITDETADARVGADAEVATASGGGGSSAAGQTRPTRSRRKRSSASRTSAASSDDGIDAVEGTLMEVALDEQGKVAEQFLAGLLDSFGLQAEVAVNIPDDDTIDIQVTGADLGLLIGPKGATLIAVQDLTRTVVQRKTSAGNGRIFIDISGYRQKRNEALSRFAQKIAADVLESKARIPLEPMSAADRKTVHDAITGIDGVETTSEGEDDRRHVVVFPVDS